MLQRRCAGSLGVSEELSSVETKELRMIDESNDTFQKNLVVWKPRSNMERRRNMKKVSEELSSVETDIEIHFLNIK